MPSPRFDSPSPGIRVEYGRYLIPNPETGKHERYTRVTNFIGVLEDRTGLERWGKRKVIEGLAKRSDLVRGVQAILNPNEKDSKKKLDDIANEAMNASGAFIKREEGTAWHTITENYHATGRFPDGVDPVIANAYLKAIEPLTFEIVEAYLVIDRLKVAGRCDAIVTHRDYPGKRFIADLKTGSLTYGAAKVGLQLACYAWADLVDEDGNRNPHGCDRDSAIVIDFDAEENSVNLRWVDIRRAAPGLALCRDVRAWRNNKDFFIDSPQAA